MSDIFISCRSIHNDLTQAFPDSNNAQHFDTGLNNFTWFTNKKVSGNHLQWKMDWYSSRVGTKIFRFLLVGPCKEPDLRRVENVPN